MPNILAISGRKQAGKNTAGNFFLGLKMIELGLTRGIEISNKGELRVKDIWGDESFAGIFQYYSFSSAVKDFIDENIHPYYKMYSFADILKREVCIKLLGLKEEHCFGTDEQKNSFTHLKWEDMPGVITEVVPQDPIDKEVAGRLGKYYDKVLSGMIYHPPGYMTGREVMQFVGTDVFRRMYGQVWSASTINKIVEENSEFAVITDCRFPNEVEAVQKAGGKVVRLLRDPFNDQHDSEKALDNYKGFDLVIDNTNMPIGEVHGMIYDKLTEWNYPVLDLKDI